MSKRSVPPPPTRFAPPAPAQPKAHQTSGQVRIPPPPTRFGAPAPVQPKTARTPEAGHTPPPPPQFHVPAPIQRQGQAAVVQRAKRNDTAENTRPTDAVGSIRRFKLNNTTYAQDKRGNRWYWHGNGYWVRQKIKAVPLHNRFKVSVEGRGAVRAASFRARQGSGASYSDTRRRRIARKSSRLFQIKHASKAKRTYRANMQTAATADGVATNSATIYATAKGAPTITGGYNWCHLVGHGGGGSDTADNLVAASTHANSEQLELERILYKFKAKGLFVRAEAELMAGTAHVATAIIYTVYYDGSEIYRRIIDGFRPDSPTYTELKEAEEQLMDAIARAAPP